MRRRELILAAGVALASPAVARTTTQSTSTPASTDVYVKTFGAKGDGVTDDSAAINAAIASLPLNGRPPRLVFDPGCYVISRGVVESVPGIVAVGLGARCQGPGGQATAVGVTLRLSGTGWVWQHLSPTGANEYRGGRFESITFQGNASSAGGFFTDASYSVLQDCGSFGSSTGVGFKIMPPPSGDSAQLNMLRGCGSENDLIGAQIGESGMVGYCQTLIDDFISLGSAEGATGSGVDMWDNGSQIIGGKIEGHAYGVRSFSSTVIDGMRFENCAVYDVELNRPAPDASGTNNVVFVPYCRVHVGPNNVADVIVGPVDLTNESASTAFLGAGILKTWSSGDRIPSGGMPGEIRVANGRLWWHDDAGWNYALKDGSA